MVCSLLDTLNTHTQTAASVTDTVLSHTEHKENIFVELLHHIQDSKSVEIPFDHIELPHFLPINIFGIEFDLSITKHVVFLWVAAFIVLIVTVAAARRNKKTLIPKGIGNLIEVFIVFIRDEIVVPNMGRSGIKYMPYLLTTFFFILIMNLIGLVPYGATSTSNVSVTAGLAIIAFIMIQYSAIRKQGLGHYLAHLTGGMHWILWPIMIPTEILGLLTKPFVLCIRLFANMTGGHIVIVSLIGLIFIFQTIWIAPIPIAFLIGINMFEIFVALLQAYIFTILTAIFMGLGMQASEHEENSH
ncbi:MAG: F0F1 ATP synthase subunit A [Bacteroidetes bacterium]|nr:F0F1 ATP synthase subunit A [Bacteroidota bacterium]